MQKYSEIIKCFLEWKEYSLCIRPKHEDHISFGIIQLCYRTICSKTSQYIPIHRLYEITWIQDHAKDGEFAWKWWEIWYSPKKIDRERSEKIKYATEMHKNGQITVEEFLQAVSIEDMIPKKGLFFICVDYLCHLYVWLCSAEVTKDIISMQ